MIINEIDGDVIKLILTNEYDVLAQGNNCFNRQASGLAVDMVTYFQTDTFPMEKIGFGDVKKLGLIDYRPFTIKEKRFYESDIGDKIDFYIVNCYSQFYYKRNSNDKPFDYDAFTNCMVLLNEKFSNKRILLPKIGSSLAGGDWIRIKDIIISKLKNVESITFVTYKP